MKNLLTPFVLLFFLLGAGCQDPTLWDHPLAEVSGRLSSSDYDFIKNIDFSRYKSSDIYKLGPHAPFYTYFIFSKLGMHEKALASLCLSVENETGLWLEKAGYTLLGEYLAEESYALAEETGKLLIQRGIQTAPVLKRYLEALYWQKKDEELLAACAVYGKEVPAITDQEWDEVLLFTTVAASRLGRANWPQSFELLFSQVSASELHTRFYGFITKLPAALAQLNEAQINLLSGKYYLARGDRATARPYLERYFTLAPVSSLQHTQLIRELGFIYLNSPDPQAGAEALARLAQRLAPSPERAEQYLLALEMAARCRRKAQDTQAAAALFRQVLSQTADARQAERCRWFLLEMAQTQSSSAALAELENQIAFWQNNDYFADVIGALTTELLINRETSLLQGLYDLLRSHVHGTDPEFQSAVLRLEYLLLRQGSRPASFYQTGSYSYSLTNLYYCLLIAYLGESKLPTPAELFSRFAHPVPAEPSDFTIEEYTRLYLFFGLNEEGFTSVYRYHARMSVEFLKKCAAVLAVRGYPSQAITTSYLYLLKGLPRLDGSDWKLAYPQVYADIIRTRSREQELPLNLSFALIRSESTFAPAIVSSAGAVGLCQLMPETAREMSERLRLTDYDLTNPADNILLGLAYYKLLTGKTGNYAKSLMAYNAGITNLKRWETQYPDLPADLLGEIMPFAETSLYLKKVLTASYIYSWLLRSKNDPISEFYGSLK